ncbi:MAG: DUF3078 domain-containing protein [Bacteroidetes bacterium]|nr:DUF3078 domain-containing protein [Bacteroidota bacterium]
MKKILILLVILVSSSQVFSQAAKDTSWKKGGFVNVNFTQVSLNQWAQGGENSLSLAGNANLFANYAKEKTTWDNSLELAYALLKSGATPFRKNDDRIDFTTKYGRLMKGKWYYSALVNLKSQITKGYKYPDDSTVVSKFLAPGYITIALGVNYKPVDYFEVFISPATGRYTIVTDQTLADFGAYGVEPATRDASGTMQKGTGKNVKAEFGAYLNMKFKKEIMQNVTLSTKLELFDNYTDKDKNNQTNIDVNWETGFTLKVNKLITATVATQLIYDHNIIRRTQFKEVIGVGLGYKF